MKKTFWTTTFLMVIFLTVGQTNSILSPRKVGTRDNWQLVNLYLAILFFYQDRYKFYVHDIHTHFDKYKNHSLIKFAEELRDSSDLVYNRVMEIAIDLKFKLNVSGYHAEKPILKGANVIILHTKS